MAIIFKYKLVRCVLLELDGVGVEDIVKLSPRQPIYMISINDTKTNLII